MNFAHVLMRGYIQTMILRRLHVFPNTIMSKDYSSGNYRSINETETIQLEKNNNRRDSLHSFETESN